LPADEFDPAVASDVRRKEVGKMAACVELPRVKTWYDERGEGEPLVLPSESAA
jgi:hypothetical protein